MGGRASAILISGAVYNYQAIGDGGASAKMQGGEVVYLSAFGDTTISVSGGAVSEVIIAGLNGLIYLDGSDFTVTDLSGNTTLLSYGDRLGDLGSFVENDTQDYYGGIISGTLANGDVLATNFMVYADTGSIGGSCDIVIIPEPASMWLLLSGGWLVRRKRRWV